MQLTLQSALLIVLPLITPLVGTSIAAIIAQNRWPIWFNDGLAWFFLLAFAGADMYANSQFSSGWITIAADAVQAITLLSSGWLVKLTPWLIWLNWLQGNVFDLVPLFEQAVKPTSLQPLTSIGTRAYVPTGQAAPPPDVPDIPKRASAPPPPQG